MTPPTPPKPPCLNLESSNTRSAQSLILATESVEDARETSQVFLLFLVEILKNEIEEDIRCSPPVRGSPYFIRPFLICEK